MLTTLSTKWAWKWAFIPGVGSFWMTLIIWKCSNPDFFSIKIGLFNSWFSEFTEKCAALWYLSLSLYEISRDFGRETSHECGKVQETSGINEEMIISPLVVDLLCGFWHVIVLKIMSCKHPSYWYHLGRAVHCQLSTSCSCSSQYVIQYRTGYWLHHTLAEINMSDGFPALSEELDSPLHIQGLLSLQSLGLCLNCRSQMFSSLFPNVMAPKVVITRSTEPTSRQAFISTTSCSPLLHSTPSWPHSSSSISSFSHMWRSTFPNPGSLRSQEGGAGYRKVSDN